MNRRSMLKLLGSMPVVGPGLARKLSSEASAAGLAQLNTSGLQQTSFPAPSPPDSLLTQRRLAMQLPWVRQELEQLLAEQHHHVSVLDTDLAVLKSVSLSAKICYQRQRNIKSAMLRYETKQPWERIEKLFSTVRGILG